MIAVEQIKAARAMLNLSQKELAKKAGIAIATLNNIECGAQTDPKISTLKSIQQALENEGIVFTNDALGVIGIMLKPKRPLINDARILIVDDNKADRILYKHWLSDLKDAHYQIIEAENARAGFDEFIRHQPHCLILDFMMYGADGFQLLAALRQEHVKLPPIIFITGMHNKLLEESARSQGVFAYLNKQKLDSNELCTTVRNALMSVS